MEGARERKGLQKEWKALARCAARLKFSLRVFTSRVYILLAPDSRLIISQKLPLGIRGPV